MSNSPVKRKIEINLEFPLVLLIALIAWRYGGFITASFVAWTMAVVTLVGLGLLSYLCSTQPHNASVKLGGLRVESSTLAMPSKRTSSTLVLGILSFGYMAFHGHPLALVGVVALVVEMLPGTPSVWDEYMADVLRRATVQAGFGGMLAAVVVAIAGSSALEVAIVAGAGYLLSLQVYLFRWQKANAINS